MKKLYIAIIVVMLGVSAQAFDFSSLSNMIGSKTEKNDSLISKLTSSLGVTNAQATGGAAALLGASIMNMVKAVF